MVTAEKRTFMKTGGLGDVAVDLPEAFNNEYNKGDREAPDIIDANDWHAGPLATQFKYLMPAKAANGETDNAVAESLKELPIAYTLHKLEYQGWDFPNTSRILNLLYEDYADAIFKNAYAPKMKDTPKFVIVKGNIPVATATGGLSNTIIDNKTGFIANKYHPDYIKDSITDYNNTLDKALRMFRNNRRAFDQIAYNALKADFSWKNSGSLDKYLKLFQTGNIEGITKNSNVA